MNKIIDEKLKEFRKKFVRKDGLMDKYYYSDKDEEYCYMADAIEIFLKSFASAIIQAVGEEVEGMKEKSKFTPGELVFNVDNQREEYQRYVYNEALSGLIIRLKEMRHD